MSNEGVRVPAIPEIRVNDPATQRVLEAVKSTIDTREGRNDPLDKTLTLRDLINLGLADADIQRLGRNIQATIRPTVTGTEDSSWATIPPPMPINFSATGAFATIILDWNLPDYANHAYVELWRASANEGEAAPVFGDAVLVGQVTNAPWSDSPDASAEARTFYYWLRCVSTSGLKSAVTEPATAQLAVDPGYILSVLLAQAGSDYIVGQPLLIEVAEPTVIGGVFVPAGVYIRDLFVQNGTITNAKIANAAIDDAKISNVTANKITTGTLQVGRTITVEGAIQGGKNAYGSTDAGFWIGLDGATYRFAIGDATHFMRWTGSQLLVSGAFSASTITTSTVTATDFVGGTVRSGKTAYADTVPGYWLGFDDLDGVAKFSIGEAVNYLKWDGTTLRVQGLIHTSQLIATTMSSSVLDNSNTLIAPTYILDPDRVPGLGGGMLVAATGQPLDDPDTPPTILCYPSLLLDTSMDVLDTTLADAYVLPDDSPWAGYNYNFGCTSPSAASGTLSPDFSGPSSRNPVSPGKMRFAWMESSPGWGVRYTIDPVVFTVEPAVITGGSTNYKLCTAAGTPKPGESTYARAARTTATLRVTITDLAAFSYSAFDASGSALPPHWLPPTPCSTGFSRPDSSWPNVSSNYYAYASLFQVFVYPPFSTAPADLTAAQAATEAARDTYVAWGAEPAAPAYLLDLSKVCLYRGASLGVSPGDSLAGYFKCPAESGVLTTAVHDWEATQSELWSDSTSVTAGTSTVVQGDWTIVASYAGGVISIVAEREIDYSHADIDTGGFTATAVIGVRGDINGGFVAYPQAFCVDYEWEHLQIKVDILADNRPFAPGEVEIP